MVNIILKHGTKDYDLQLDSFKITIKELSEKIEYLTGVPSDRQRIIYKGRTLSPSDDKTLSMLALKNNCKVMMIGQKKCDEEDLLVKKIGEFDKLRKMEETKVDELVERMLGVQKGFLDASHVGSAINQIKKEAMRRSESLTQLLEQIDSVEIGNDLEVARSTRKRVVHEIQALLSRLDNLSTTTR